MAGEWNIKKCRNRAGISGKLPPERPHEKRLRDVFEQVGSGQEFLAGGYPRFNYDRLPAPVFMPGGRETITTCHREIYKSLGIRESSDI